MSAPRLLLGLLLLQTALTEDVKKQTALVGGAIEMVPVFNGHVQGFEWKKGSNKIIEVDFPPGDPKHYALKDRSNLDLTTGVLTIRRLQLTDSGSYTADVLINGQYQKTTFELLVFPTLNKPTVICRRTNGEVLVQCHHDPDPPTEEWYNDGKPIASSLQNYSLTDQNRSLTVGRLGWENVKSLECVVRNPESENRSSVPETCFEKVSPHRWVSGLIAALIIVPLILVILYGFFGPENSWLRRLFDPLRKRIQAARNDDHNSRRGSKSEDGQSDNQNDDRSANEENQSSHAPKRADAVPNYPPTPLESEMTEGYGTTDAREEDSSEPLSAPLKTNQNETESKEEVQEPSEGDPLSPPSQETQSSDS